jgi:hypothetical protein
MGQWMYKFTDVQRRRKDEEEKLRKRDKNRRIEIWGIEA